jgi:predicted RNase H-like HicB family nuclease
MISPIHEAVLLAANRVASLGDGTFTPEEVVRALPHLNEYTVRTEIVSRCCVGVPKHHAKVWPYFRRVGRGRYRVEAKYRREQTLNMEPREESNTAQSQTHRSEAPGGRVAAHKRDTIHAIIQKGEMAYVAECLEVAVVTQGKTLDEVVDNLQQAIALHLEDEELATLGLTDHPRLQLIYDMALAS